MTADPTAAPDRSPSVQLDPTVQPPVILLDHQASWPEIREDARAVLEPVCAAWAGAEAHLDLGQREPDLFDLRRLVHLLKDDYDINIVGMRCLHSSLRRFAERELKVRIHLQSPPAPAPTDAQPADEEPVQVVEDGASLPAEHTSELEGDSTDEPDLETLGEPEPTSEPLGATGSPVRIIQRTLRGGNVLRHSGDLVLYGDVNPGAEVIAGGSITVLGTMMGMAHAGTRSGDRGWIIAHELRPTQLRIGQRIIISEPSKGGGQKAGGPAIAFVQDGAIVTEPYRGRLPRNVSRRSDA